MARNTRASHGKKKIEPAVQILLFGTNAIPAGTAERFYIDLSQCASLMNRRFYRQGINWAVADIKIFSNATGTVFVNKLPTTWVMSNAWEKGFRAWQKMNNEAISESESVKPKFLDFKIYANANHHNDGFGANLLPVSFDNAIDPVAYGTVQAVPGEWTASKFVVPSGGTTGVESREITAVGGNYAGTSAATGLSCISLIEGYANSRGLPYPEDPNVPDDAADSDGLTPENWLQALFNEGTEQSDEVIGDMITENNQAPYPFENDGVNTDTMYPGGKDQLGGLQIHDTALMTSTTIGGETNLRGGMFPCGLIELLVTASNENTGLSIQVDLVPGNHRGYLCEPMTEM